MPVTVSIPTRLRVDPRALRDGRAELADALATATARAVASSREKVPAASPLVAPPTFAWTGDGVGGVDTALRAEIEALCLQQIARVVGPPSAPRPHDTTVAPRPGRRPVEIETEVPAPRHAFLAPEEDGPQTAGLPVLLPAAGLEDLDTVIAPAAKAADADESRDSRTICEPFLDEPSIFLLGPLQNELWRRISDIADILEIDPCEYGGGFLLAAASALLERTCDIGLADVVEIGRNEAGGPDGASVRFRPSSSVQVEALELLASVVPLLTTLLQLLEQLPDRQGDAPGKPLGWAPLLHERLDPRLDEAVATLFRLTCRVLFLQVMNTSHVAIELRRADPAFTQFEELFERAVTRPRSEAGELSALRDLLEATKPWSPTRVSTTWYEAVEAVDDAFAGRRVASEPFEENGVRKIRDGRGRLWTLDELEGAIASRARNVESPDPLVSQLAVLPELQRKFRVPAGAVPGELRRLLDELLTTNAEYTLHALADPGLGFELAHLVPGDGMAMVPYTIYSLEGLHLLAHQTLGDDFADDFFYARGINLLFGDELGARALAGPGDLGGLVETAVVAASPVDLPFAAAELEAAVEPEDAAGAPDEEALRVAAATETAFFARELDRALTLASAPGSLSVDAIADEIVEGLERRFGASEPIPGLREAFAELARLASARRPAHSAGTAGAGSAARLLGDLLVVRGETETAEARAIAESLVGSLLDAVQGEWLEWRQARLDAIATARETLDARYIEASAALADAGTLAPHHRAAVRALVDELARELDELEHPPAPAALTAFRADWTEVGPRTAAAGTGPEPTVQTEPPADDASPPATHEAADSSDLTFRPDGVALGPRGYLYTEPASSWAPERPRFYTTPEGRAQLRAGMEARARFSSGLPGCGGWRYASGGSSLDELAASVLEELRADDPDLAARIELEAGE